ncbi:cell division protein ZapA [uncultured Cytophaga sp.]|uniref:cell division protein ZapA n=1 Tax=uncultured Cytophaga sp. TaxID=160238 RepID=UPI0026083477|nr:cell division protein ZapA [uncultured Cytophaga sp.]
MGELSIKIRISDREYPMRVDASEEEQIRAAGKLINEKLKRFREQFGIDDKQDLLSMAVIDTVMDTLKSGQRLTEKDSILQNKIEHIDHILSEALAL